MNRNIILLAVNFLSFLLAQVWLFKSLVLFDTAFCFIYIGFLLILPFELNRVVLISSGFLTGIFIDIFFDSLGLHAAASVVVMYLRTFWITTITPRGGYEIGASPGIRSLGLEWFMVYTLPLIFIHHGTLFFIEAGGFGMFFYTFFKVVSSMIFTFIVLVLVQYLFFSRRGRI